MISILFIFFAFSESISQSYGFVKTIVEENAYISGLQKSPGGRYFTYNVGSEKCVITDTSFKKVKEFYGDPLFGGNDLSLNYNDSLAAYYHTGPRDTLFIYNLYSKKSEHYVSDYITGLTFFNTCNRLIIHHSKYIEIKNLDETGSVVILPLKFSENYFYPEVEISADDRTLYIAQNNFKIYKYLTENHNIIDCYGPFNGKIENLILLNESLYFTCDDLFHQFTAATNEDIAMPLKTDYVGEMYADPEYKKIIYTGNGENTFSISPLDFSMEKMITETGSKYHYSLLRLNTDRLICGDDNKLKIYKRLSSSEENLIKPEKLFVEKNYKAKEPCVSAENIGPVFPTDFKIGDKIVRRIIFDMDGAAAPLKESTPSLDSIVDFMNENPTIGIKITHHTDYMGEDKFNLRLSQRRAESVKFYFVQQGINGERIKCEGMGEKSLLYDELFIKKLTVQAEKEAYRNRNIRTEFTIIQID